MYTHRLTVERRTPARNLLSYILCITVSNLCLQSNDKNRQGIISFRYCRNVGKMTYRYEGKWLQINPYLQSKQTNAQKHAWLRLKFSRLYIVTQASNIAVKHDSSVGRAFVVIGSILGPVSRSSR